MNLVLGRKYARALWDLADTQQAGDTIQGDLNRVSRLINAHPSLKTLLESREVKAHAKEELVGRLFRSQVSSLALHFLRLVAKRQRFTWWRDITEAFTRIAEQRRGLRRGVAVTSQVWVEEDLKALAKEFSRYFGSQVELTQRADPSVLGGVAIHVDSQVYDGTFRRRLQDIREHLMAAS